MARTAMVCLSSVACIFCISLFLYTEHSRDGYIFLLTTLIATPILIMPMITISSYNTVLMQLENFQLLDTECLVYVVSDKIVLKQEILIGSICSIGFSVIRIMLLNG